jgi:hypothetical protein
VKRAGDIELLGWEEPIFWHEAARLYQPNSVSNHGMLLGIHLFAIAKQTSNVISGDTKVILARDNGIHVIPASDVSDLEEMLRTFNGMVDELRLILPNMSIPFDEFRSYVIDFKDRVIELHERLLSRNAQQSLKRALSDPNWQGDPFRKIPPGLKLFQSDGGLLTDQEAKACMEDLEASGVLRIVGEDEKTNGGLAIVGVDTDSGKATVEIRPPKSQEPEES